MKESWDDEVVRSIRRLAVFDLLRFETAWQSLLITAEVAVRQATRDSVAFLFLRNKHCYTSKSNKTEGALWAR